MTSRLDSIDTALVTGSSGGIGEAFSRQLAAMGKNLVLVARSEDRLRALAEELAVQHGIQTHVITANLAQPLAASSVVSETERLGLEIDLLVNNAGFAKGGEFTALPVDVQADMVRLNVNSLVELTRFYLPAMRQRRQGGIINVASAAAFQSTPYLTVYGATKAFVLSFSVALAEEVTLDGVTVMALCPGATATGFWATAGLWESSHSRMHTPGWVAAKALQAFERGWSFYVPGFSSQLAAFLASRVLPRRLVARLAGPVLRRSLQEH